MTKHVGTEAQLPPRYRQVKNSFWHNWWFWKKPVHKRKSRCWSTGRRPVGSPVHLASWVLLGDQIRGRVQAAIQWGLQARSRFFLLLSRPGSAGPLGPGHHSKSTRPPVQSSCFFRSRTSIDAYSMGELTYIPIWPADPSRGTLKPAALIGWPPTQSRANPTPAALIGWPAEQSRATPRWGPMLRLPWR